MSKQEAKLLKNIHDNAVNDSMTQLTLESGDDEDETDRELSDTSDSNDDTIKMESPIHTENSIDVSNDRSSPQSLTSKSQKCRNSRKKKYALFKKRYYKLWDMFCKNQHLLKTLESLNDSTAIKKMFEYISLTNEVDIDNLKSPSSSSPADLSISNRPESANSNKSVPQTTTTSKQGQFDGSLSATLAGTSPTEMDNRNLISASLTSGLTDLRSGYLPAQIHPLNLHPSLSFQPNILGVGPPYTHFFPGLPALFRSPLNGGGNNNPNNGSNQNDVVAYSSNNNSSGKLLDDAISFPNFSASKKLSMASNENRS